MSKLQFEALTALALAGSPDALRTQQMVEEIEQRNGITVYRLLVRWEEPGRIPSINDKFPEVWPPQQTITLAQHTPIRRSDVEAAVAARHPRAINTLVTKDLSGRVGWTTLGGYFP
ncbi:MAG TPA: hypothetical protein PKW90_11605 [Myxococcota bacterium]|nr:hypothetical protein [Myxococcota bacterium]